MGEEPAADGPGDRAGMKPTGRLAGRSKDLLLVLALIVAAVVRLVGIGQQSFSIDEIHELRIAHSGLTDILTFDDGFPPFYNLLFHLFVPLGDLAGRVLSAVFGVATVGVAWAWARRAAGARVGLVAAWFVALAPMCVQLSGEGRAYGLTALLAAASLWTLWIALEEPSPHAWVRWGIVSAIGIYTHYLFAALIAAWLVVALIEVRGKISRAMWMGIGTLALLAAPAAALLSSDLAVQAHHGTGLVAGEVLYSGYRLVAGVSLGPSMQDLLSFGFIEAIRATWVWIVVLGPPVGLLLVQGYRALDRVARRRLLCMSILGLGLELGTTAVAGMGFGASYVTWLVVPLAVWLAAGLTRLRSRWRWATATVLLVVAVYSLVAQNLDPHHQVGDARSVAAYLESSAAPGQPVLVSGVQSIRPILYYMDRPLALALPEKWDPETGRLGYYEDEELPLTGIPSLATGESDLADALQVLDASAGPGEPYYLVYTQPFYSDRHGELLATLTARDGLTLVQEFAGMDVYRGVRAA